MSESYPPPRDPYSQPETPRWANPAETPNTGQAAAWPSPPPEAADPAASTWSQPTEYAHSAGEPGQYAPSGSSVGYNDDAAYPAPPAYSPPAYPPATAQPAYELPSYDPIPSEAPSTDTGSDQSKVDTAKEQAGAVGQSAAQAGQQVASTAKDQAQNVVAEAGTQAKDLLHQTRSQLTEQAGTQQQRLAAGLRSLGDELKSMAQGSDKSGPATDLVGQAAGHTHTVASWLDEREPGQLLQEAQDFARRRPAAFLAIAAGAGLLVGRLGRGIKDAGSDDSADTPAAAPVASPSTEPASQYGAYGTAGDASPQTFPEFGSSATYGTQQSGTTGYSTGSVQ